MQSLIRLIGVLALFHNFDIRINHIPSLLNARADPLSRLQMDAFRCQVGDVFQTLSEVQPADLPSSSYENLSGDSSIPPLTLPRTVITNPQCAPSSSS